MECIQVGIIEIVVLEIDLEKMRSLETLDILTTRSTVLTQGLDGMEVDHIKRQNIFSSSPLATGCLCRLKAYRTLSLPKSSMRKWRICTFLHSVRRSMSPPKNKQIMQGLRCSVEGVVAGSVFGFGLLAATNTRDFGTGRYTSRLVSLTTSTVLSAAVSCGGLSRMALYTSAQGSSASAVPAHGMVCSHSSMVVSGQGPAMYAVSLYGQWVCTHSLPKGSHCAEAGSDRYINIIVQRNGVWPPACVTSSSGRTSQQGDPRSNPQGAGADRPCCLLSTACLKTNSTTRRETCEDRHARLPCGDAVPEV